MSDLTKKYGRAVVYGVIGLIVAILILAIGFWATLLLAVLAGAGYLIGKYRDGNETIRRITQELARKAERIGKK